MTHSIILDLFDQWNQALQSNDSQDILRLYHSDALLLPTFSSHICSSHHEISAYFDSFMTKKPVGKITSSHVRIFDDWAIHSGLYTFTLADQSSIHARFSFVYKNDDDDWKIIEHHSSQVPLSSS